jgi:translocator protein
VEIMKIWSSILVLAVFIAICFGVAAAGAWFTRGSVTTWYPTVSKPAWNPPAWLFGPVWTVLYVMMAIAAWLVWRRAGFSGASGALGIFALQLALNAAWSPLFFGMRNPAAGLVDIAALWIAIGATLIAFWRVLPPAAVLLLPYWLWVSFATALNFAIWRMNT